MRCAGIGVPVLKMTASERDGHFEYWHASFGRAFHIANPNTQPLPAQRACRRRCRDRADIEPCVISSCRYTRAYACVYAHVYAHAYTHIYKHVYTHAHTHAHTHVHRHVGMQFRITVHANLCPHACKSCRHEGGHWEQDDRGHATDSIRTQHVTM